MKALAQTTMAVLLMAFALAYLGPSLDGHTTYSSYGATPEEPVQPTPLDAEIIACQALHGPNAYAVALPDGQHRCTDKRGRKLARTAITVVHRSAP